MCVHVRSDVAYMLITTFAHLYLLYSTRGLPRLFCNYAEEFIERDFLYRQRKLSQGSDDMHNWLINLPLNDFVSFSQICCRSFPHPVLEPYGNSAAKLSHQSIMQPPVVTSCPCVCVVVEHISILVLINTLYGLLN